MATIERVPRQFFSGLGRIQHDIPERSLRSILNEIIDCVNVGVVAQDDLLLAQFDFTAWSTGWVSLGTCSAGRSSAICVVDVKEPFNGGAQITVGDPVAQGRLQVVSGNDLSQVYRYHSNPDHVYSVDQQLYIYMSAGAPTAGSGQVLVYLS